MKLIALKPIYFGGTVVTEGLPLETVKRPEAFVYGSFSTGAGS